jgi:hypothetical protein
MTRRSPIPTRRHPLATVARRPGRRGSAAPGSRPVAPAGPRGTSGASDTRIARTVGLLVVITATGWLLTTELVSGPLAIPVTSIDALRRWLDDTTPAVVPAALLRLAALGACAYLALALVLTLVAQLVDRRTGGRAVEVVRRLLPTALRSLLAGGAQLSLVAVTALPATALPAAAAMGDPPSHIATMAKVGAAPTPARPDTPTGATSTATMTRLPTSAPTTVSPTTASPTTASPTTTVTPIAPTTAPTSLAPVPLPPRASAPANPSVTADAADETWTVTAGDTFWSIAEEALTDQRGSFPSQHEIVRYWRQLIATNQARLAAPGNPDLLLPGQSLLLPPPT